MKLRIAKNRRDGEETIELGDVDSTAEADAMLSKSEHHDWIDAILCRTDAEGRTIVEFRRGSSGWFETRHWPTDFLKWDRRDDACVEEIVSWLERAGVKLDWQSLREPWPGHESGDICGRSTDVGRMMREMRRREISAISAVVRMTIMEGSELGGLVSRERHGGDFWEKQAGDVAAINEELRTKIFDLENEVRRLKGEPELVREDVEKEARELAIQAVKDFCEQRKKDAQDHG